MIDTSILQTKASEVDGGETAAAMKTAEPDEEEPIPELGELVLALHGIGQALVSSWGVSWSITTAVNALRANSTKYAAAKQNRPLLQHKRLCVIPIRWRALLDEDLKLEPAESDEPMFNLDACQPPGISSLRSVGREILFDVPLYLSHHRDQIVSTVVKEANRIVKLFARLNPEWNGKVSIIAHSLGSIIASDILNDQPTWVEPLSKSIPPQHFCFNVRTLINLGSPLAIFLRLNAARLVARRGRARTRKDHDDHVTRKSKGQNSACEDWSSPDAHSLQPGGRLVLQRSCVRAVRSHAQVFAANDPLAFLIAPAVDARHASRFEAEPIVDSTASLTAAFSDKLSALFEGVPLSLSSFWMKEAKQADGPVDLTDEQKASIQAAMQAEEVTEEEAALIERAEKRMYALNPCGRVDFSMPSQTYLGETIDALSAHGSYWVDERLAVFLTTQLLAPVDIDRRTGTASVVATPAVEGRMSFATPIAEQRRMSFSQASTYSVD